MFEDKLIEQILKAWEFDQSHPHRDRKPIPIPKIDVVKNVFECAFQASLEKEEGKPITFSLAILLKEELKETKKAPLRQHMIVHFSDDLPFTIEAITKISSAFDPRTAALLVCPKKNIIWGATIFQKSFSRFEKIPAANLQYDTFRPDTMMITAISTGNLIISRGDSMIGQFKNGKFEPAIPTPFISKAMGNFIIKNISNDSGYLEYENFYWHIYRDSLDYLLSEISMRGQGGTLIIFPKKHRKEYKEKIEEKYLVGQDLQIEVLILEKLAQPKKNKGFVSEVLYNKLLAERFNTIAQLACIDGALILSTQFEVFSFGSKLTAQKWSGSLQIGPDGCGGGGGNFDNTILGTRHNSVINFIGECPDAVGFVIFQDGPIRGFTKKDDKTILCWPDFRVSVFV